MDATDESPAAECPLPADDVVAEASRLEELTLHWSQSLGRHTAAAESRTDSVLEAIRAAGSAVAQEARRIEEARASIAEAREREQRHIAALLEEARRLRELVERLILVLESRVESS